MFDSGVLKDIVAKYGPETSIADALWSEWMRLKKSNQHQRKELKKLRRAIHFIKREIKE